MNSSSNLQITGKIILASFGLIIFFQTFQSTSIHAEIASTANSPPTISDIPDQVTDEDQAIGPLWFTIGDLETPVDELIVTGTSSNLAVVSNSGIFLGGYDDQRWVEITPVTHAIGSTLITITVDDGQDTTFDLFQITVGSVEDAPIISAILDQVTPVDTVLGPIPFTIWDAETPADELSLAAVSSDQGIIADSDILLGGTGENRTITLTPVPGASSSTTITISVGDGVYTTYEYFRVLVSTIKIYFPYTRAIPVVVPPVIILYFPVIINGN